MNNLLYRLTSMVFFLSVLSVPFTSRASAEIDTCRQFEKATQLFSFGDTDGAIKILEGLVDAGRSSANIYYNLGTAYLKKASVGKAILNYERGRKISPADPVILSNLNKARSLMKRSDSAEPRFILLRWTDMAFSYLTTGQAMLLYFFLYYALALYVIISKVFKRFTANSNILITISVLLLLLTALSVNRKIFSDDHAAIVLGKITDVKYEPANDSESAFPLYEGMKVFILRHSGEWSKVKVPNGRVGWVENKLLSSISNTP